MQVIVCLGDRNGMCFGGRRQSRDRVVSEKILEIVGDARLWIHPYSANLFENDVSGICADADFLDRAENLDYCFVETDDILEYLPKMQSLIVFRWNRQYPADKFFPEVEEMHLCSTVDFPGNSHEKITMEVYAR